ncbi:hypothetical protein MKW98_028604 [Papaver atlanticum]|uniref:3'-5' exonuclease domain-containing protein n=1 Tax=Papaver atlanticum TaxID=357466 RepID=A0AAD4S1B0_9MAGN|nr:hypothetical protein MKW98_001653 [Papaver atlanticum]KAI3916997.1 hypothetical protein MKW98_028604 [Papaver atlanticum]
MSIYHLYGSSYTYIAQDEEDDDYHVDRQQQGHTHIHTREVLARRTGRQIFNRWIDSSLYYGRYQYRNRTLVVGLGVQWLPPYPGSVDPAKTLQLCFGTRCLIIQLSHTPYVPRILRRFLGDEKITFAGIWNHMDEKKLLMSEHQLYVTNLVNLSNIGTSGNDPVVGRSNWNARNLRHDQVQYACVHAHVLAEIGKKLEVWNYKC